MQRITEQSIEERFGLAVADHRRVLGLSQKALADHLTEYGLPLDASAISRIEKGARALRLSEASTIANTLGFDLSDIEYPYDVAKRFEQKRRMVDKSLDAASEGILQLGNALGEMAMALYDPGILEQMTELQHPGAEAPTDMPSYIRWVAARWVEAQHDRDFEYLLEDEAKAAHELVSVMARSLIRQGER